MRWTVLALACLALAGCESTQERSAKLEKENKRRALAQKAGGLKIAARSRTIEVVAATALHSSEGSAVAVELANSGPAQREVPIAISVAQAGGPAVSNTAPGLARSLTSAAYVPAHGRAVWVDDQVALTGTPGKVTAKVGEGHPATGAAPKITIGSHALESESGSESVTGTVANASTVEQHELVVYAVAQSGGRVVAAGRGVVSALGAGGSDRFQIFLTGSARGAKLALSAPPASFG